MTQNGKGDSPRNCFSQQYRDNYDAIFRRDRSTTKPAACEDAEDLRRDY